LLKLERHWIEDQYLVQSVALKRLGLDFYPAI